MVLEMSIPFDDHVFWTEHLGPPAFDFVATILGDNIRHGKRGRYKGHRLIWIGYAKDYDLGVVKGQLREGLDAIKWQFVTTGGSMEFPDGSASPCFGIAPIIEMKVSIAYHATRLRVIDVIPHEGLLPSNSERSATGFPDTEGTICVCEKLTCAEGENKGADWWMNNLSRHVGENVALWGIVQIDVARLTNARVHQDIHSESGLIVDRFERIPNELITVIRGRPS
jgi:hypothetical protein